MCDLWFLVCLRGPIAKDRKTIAVIDKDCFVVKEKIVTT